MFCRIYSGAPLVKWSLVFGSSILAGGSWHPLPLACVLLARCFAKPWKCLQQGRCCLTLHPLLAQSLPCLGAVLKHALCCVLVLKSSKEPFSKSSLSLQAGAHTPLVTLPAPITMACRTEKRILIYI